MQLNCFTVLPTSLVVIGACMYSICGYLALNGTMDLFKNYGPEEGRGNPALDPPPQYRVNSDTQKQELVNSNNPGNVFPGVVQGMQYFLIAIGVVMFLSALGLFYALYKSKNAFNDVVYHGQITSCANPSYLLAVIAYLILLIVACLLMASFSVLPLVEYFITSLRCSDMKNPDYTPRIQRDICVDLVQYGIVPYKEMPGSGYGLICGGNGAYTGDLAGLCANYTASFNLYIVCFAGACIALLAVILFTTRLVSIYNRMKDVFAHIKHHPNGDPHHQVHHVHPGGATTNGFGKSVHNPNYEHNVLLYDQAGSNVVGGSYAVLPIPPGGDGAKMKAELYNDATGDHMSTRKSKKNSIRSSFSSNGPVDAIPLVPLLRSPSYQSAKRLRHPSSDSMENIRPKGSVVDVMKKPPVSPLPSDSDPEDHDSNDARSERAQSTIGYRAARPQKRRSRSTRSDPDLYRKSGRRPAPRLKPPTIEEYDSPPSDYYLQEDVQRRSIRLNSKARSVY